MTGPHAYLDYNATAPLRAVALDAMTAAAALTGNPSSVHGPGRAARQVLEVARSTIAATVGAGPAEVVFTSGGTEANNMAIHGLGASVLYDATAHDSIRAPAEARGGIAVPVQPDGRIDLKALEELLRHSAAPALVAIVAANNETGILQPVTEIAALVHAHRGLLLCDAVQALGRVPVKITDMGADALVLSAHKVGGPKGVGALVLRPGLDVKPLILGGGQERRRRSGTENLMGIAGFAAAVTASQSDDWAAVAQLRDDLEGEIQRLCPDAIIIGHDAPRLPNTSAIVLPGVASQTQVMTLDLAGVAVSAGSACSSGKVQSSHVLMAMGYDQAFAGAVIRVSLGPQTTRADVDCFLSAWGKMAARRQMVVNA